LIANKLKPELGKKRKRKIRQIRTLRDEERKESEKKRHMIVRMTR
jgi:hypothetical protein